MDCVSCGDYTGEDRWRKYCKACYARMKREEEEERADQLSHVMAENLELRMQLSAARSNGGPLSLEMVRRLLQLCHPDKHNDSSNATEMTRWLLEMKRKLENGTR